VVDKGTLRQCAVIIHIPVLDVGKETVYQGESWLNKQTNHVEIGHHQLNTWRRNRQTVTMVMITLHYEQYLEITKKGTMFMCKLITSICR